MHGAGDQGATRRPVLAGLPTLVAAGPSQAGAAAIKSFFHLLRFHGLLAPHAAGRAQIIPRGRDAVDQEGGPVGAGLGPGAGEGAPPAAGSAGLSWATLMKRVFALEVLRCPRCGGQRRIVAVYSGGPRLRELLERLGLGDRSSRPPPEPAG